MFYLGFTWFHHVELYIQPFKDAPNEKAQAICQEGTQHSLAAARQAQKQGHQSNSIIRWSNLNLLEKVL